MYDMTPRGNMVIVGRKYVLKGLISAKQQGFGALFTRGHQKGPLWGSDIASETSDFSLNPKLLTLVYLPEKKTRMDFYQETC